MISHGFRRRALFHEKFLVGSITYFRNVFFLVLWLGLDVIRTEIKTFYVFLFISM